MSSEVVVYMLVRTCRTLVFFFVQFRMKKTEWWVHRNAKHTDLILLKVYREGVPPQVLDVHITCLSIQSKCICRILISACITNLLLKVSESFEPYSFRDFFTRVSCLQSEIRDLICSVTTKRTHWSKDDSWRLPVQVHHLSSTQNAGGKAPLDFWTEMVAAVHWNGNGLRRNSCSRVE